MTHIIVDADKVLAQALEVKQQILDYREKVDERKIAKAMTKKKHFWSKATLTREEAIAFLDERSMFDWRSQRGWGICRLWSGLSLLQNRATQFTWIQKTPTPSGALNDVNPNENRSHLGAPNYTI